MGREERRERRAIIRLIVCLMKRMSIVRIRQVLEAVIKIDNG